VIVRVSCSDVVDVMCKGCDLSGKNEQGRSTIIYLRLGTEVTTVPKSYNRTRIDNRLFCAGREQSYS
jgi:hypothetical protein